MNPFLFLRKKTAIFYLLLGISQQLLAQYGMGTPTPNPQAALEVFSEDKGVLLPRLGLTSSTLFLSGVTATASHTSMLVYNTNTATNTGLVGEGYYYWDGNQWEKLINASGLAVTSLTQMVFSAEYPGGALSADGTDNLVNITSNNSGAPAFMNYYEVNNFATDGGTNDFDIILRFTLPEDFNSWDTTNAIVIDYEGTTNANFEADVYEEGNATALQDNATVSGTGLGAFAENTVAAALAGLTAGETGIIQLKITVTDAATTETSIMRLGDITLNFSRNRY